MNKYFPVLFFPGYCYVTAFGSKREKKTKYMTVVRVWPRTGEGKKETSNP